MWFFFSPPPAFKGAISLSEYLPSDWSKEKQPEEWHVELTPSSAFFPCRLKEKSCIFPWTSERLSERHGTCTHSPCYPLPLKGWQLHHSESKFWSQYLAAQRYFFFSHWAAEIRDPTDITEFTLFLLLPVLPLLLSSEGSVWPPNTPDTLCCYFQYKISIQGLLDASQCLFSTPPTWVLTKCKTNWAFFRNWHFSGSICQNHNPC